MGAISLINDRCESSKVIVGGAILEQVALSGIRQHTGQATKSKPENSNPPWPLLSFCFRFLLDFIP